MKMPRRLILLLIVSLCVLKTIHFMFGLPRIRKSALEKAEQGKVTVTVYYEALCPDSRNFILHHLLPVYTTIPGYIRLDLVPYGKAKTIEVKGSLGFRCQHGTTECVANKIHSCAINQLKNDPLLQIQYISCMIENNMVPHNVAAECAVLHGVDYKSISSCADGTEGSLLLKNNGQRTHALRPAVTYVPTIELNGVQNNAVLGNLLTELCAVFNIEPSECPDS